MLIKHRPTVFSSRPVDLQGHLQGQDRVTVWVRPSDYGCGRVAYPPLNSCRAFSAALWSYFLLLLGGFSFNSWPFPPKS